MAFTEIPIPDLPPEQRPERLMLIDTKVPNATAAYVTPVYEWLHQVAKGERETDAVVQRDGPHVLILLQSPMRATCTSTGWSCRILAALLHIDGEGSDLVVTGWLVDNHEEAMKTYDMLIHPEAAEVDEDADMFEDDDDG